MIAVICPVRGCGQPLERGAHQWTCDAKHAFDVARSGYCNLLQANERRSRTPGDSIAVARARRQLFERGLGRRFVADIVAIGRELGFAGPILDAGCGEGFHLTSLCERFGTDGVGIDISTPSIDLAAKASRELTWIVANVDRRLPLADHSIGTVFSITSRVNRKEFARVLCDGGHLVIVTPGADDLAQLRKIVLGSCSDLVRRHDITDHDPLFELVRRVESREEIDADHDVAAALLLTTYRGQRFSQLGAAEGLSSLSVTQSREILVHRRRHGSEAAKSKRPDP